MSLADLDPTGTLSAASAAISLVGTILRVAPAVKTFAASRTASTSTVPGQPSPLHRAATAPEGISAIPRDPECERRAYETVNFVLREIGSRLCAAGLVNEHALTSALMAATQHIEVRLFSGEANRLFESLAPKLADPILVNSVFTSIYLLGALMAELSSSLPNYKDTYVPLGPRMVQQLFWAAIGEDAFRDNLSANLDAFKTLAATSGLLRPTDIGYHTFPRLPSFAPCKYSSKSFNEVRHNKNIYDKLVKHFNRAGFPQPTPARQAEVGLIRDWRFLTSDSNSRTFDVEKADRNIGENFGKVLHWLICSAERLPPGQAVIAYYDQHVEFVKWIGHRMGYAVLDPGYDLNLSGVHSQLDGRCQYVLHSWVILMSSDAARTAKQTASEQWMKSRAEAAARVPRPPPSSPQSQPTSQARPTPATSSADSVTAVIATKPQPIPTPVPAPAPIAVTATEMPTGSRPLGQEHQKEQLERIHRHFQEKLVPSCQQLLSNLPSEAKPREFECSEKVFSIEREVIYLLDALHLSGDEPARAQRKEVMSQAQKLIDTLNAAISSKQPLTNNQNNADQGLTASSPSTPGGLGSPPPYSPAILASATPATSADAFPFPNKRTSTVIRRKAPPPPKKFTPAKALFDFEPDLSNGEVGFQEGDEIEIIEKTAALEEEGWCRARVKGQKTIGLMPLEYLEVEPQKITQSSPANLPAQVQATSPEGAATKPQVIPTQQTQRGAVATAPELGITSNYLQHHESQPLYQTIESSGWNASTHDSLQSPSLAIVNPTVQPGHQIPQAAHAFQQPISPAQAAQYVPPSNGFQNIQQQQQQVPLGYGPQYHGPPPFQPAHERRGVGLAEGLGLGVTAAGVAASLMPSNDAPATGQTGQEQIVIQETDNNQTATTQNAQSETSSQTDPASRTNDPVVIVLSNNSNTSAAGDVPISTFTDQYINPSDSVAMTDLSAFSEPPFDPQPSTVPTFPVTFPLEPAFVPEEAYLPPVADSETTIEETTVVEDTEIQTSESLFTADISPLASLATPQTQQPARVAEDGVANSTIIDYNTNVESTTFVDESSSASTDTMVTSADPTQCGASDFDDDTALDLI